MIATRRKYSWKKMLCTIAILAMFLPGCGLMEDRIQKGSGDSDVNTPKIGLITGQDGIDDPNYKKAWEGLQKAEQDFKVGIGYVKAKTVKDYPSKLAELKNDKYEIIITLDSGAVPAVLEAANKNPKIKYICLDAVLDSPIPANVLGVAYKVEEAAFLAGYLSGKMTQSRVVGFISGDNKAASLRYYYGYKAGIKYSYSGSELMKGIAGTFTNKNRIKEMAERMVESKADVIFHVAGTAGKSMIKVMDGAGKYSVGVDVDQNNLAPESVITSVIKNNDLVIYEISKQLKEKNLILGNNRVYGLAENGVGLAETTKDMIPENIYSRMLQYQSDIIGGKMPIPSNENEYLKFQY